MNFLGIITFMKKSPEKLISWFLLTIFILLGSYLAISWPRRKAILWEEITVPEINREPVVKAAVFVDFGDLLVRKPAAYYHDLIQRNPFARLPDVALRIPDENGEIIINGRLEVRLIYRGHMLTSEGPVAFIDGREAHVARKGDEIEGWRIIKIDREEVKIYNEREGRELLLPLGGGPEEEERLRREREERRERRPERDRREDIRFEEVPPLFEEMFPPGERRR